jgi:hypothetical protein
VRSYFSSSIIIHLSILPALFPRLMKCKGQIRISVHIFWTHLKQSSTVHQLVVELRCAGVWLHRNWEDGSRTIASTDSSATLYCPTFIPSLSPPTITILILGNLLFPNVPSHFSLVNPELCEINNCFFSCKKRWWNTQNLEWEGSVKYLENNSSLRLSLRNLWGDKSYFMDIFPSIK